MKPFDRMTAIEESGLTPTERHVLTVICRHMGPKDVCWPGVKRLAQRTGYTERTVSRTIQTLDGRGLVVERRKGQSNHYGFDPKALPNPRPRVTPDTESPPTQSPGTPDTGSGGPPTQSPGTPDTVSPEVVKEEIKEENREESAPTGAAKNPNSVSSIWVTECQAKGWVAAAPNRDETRKLAAVWKQAGPDVLRKAVRAYLAAVQDGSHWSKSKWPSVSMMLRDLPKWAEQATAPTTKVIHGHELQTRPDGRVLLDGEWTDPVKADFLLEPEDAPRQPQTGGLY